MRRACLGAIAICLMVVAVAVPMTDVTQSWFSDSEDSRVEVGVFPIAKQLYVTTSDGEVLHDSMSLNVQGNAEGKYVVTHSGKYNLSFRLFVNDMKLVPDSALSTDLEYDMGSGTWKSYGIFDSGSVTRSISWSIEGSGEYTFSMEIVGIEPISPGSTEGTL